ncbi:MAG: methyltransferase domain-containing protein [Synergistaceae bacterium]|jgi:ubiquinone/menaquinone biosynthesis C-methylase UbiE|nr:methyltransferase domain-containing protein [Synergistaceae bacterium]
MSGEDIKRLAGKGIFPHKLAWSLLIPLRNIVLSPKKLIERLELKDDFTVLEVGPGPGYFSVKVADALTRGKLILADIQQEMLDYAKRRIEKRGLTNVEYHLCDGESFPFRDNVFDRIFLVTVLGEVENQSAYLNEFRRMLKTGGILSISELAGDPDKIPAESLRKLTASAGFGFGELRGSKWNYTMNVRKI